MGATLKNDNLIRRTLRALGIFGGVQSITVIFSVVRVKLIAIWLGADGMGLFGIFNSAVELVASATQLNMRGSAVRDISGAGERVGRVCCVVMRWAWILGLTGAFAMMAFAPLLSRYTFGNGEFAWPYRILSIAVFLISIQNGFSAVMQGTENLGRLAKTQLLGALGGFALSVPMFYYWRIDSVVPSIIVYALSGAAVAWFYRVRLTPVDSRPTVRETVREGAGFLRLGLYMTVSSFASVAASYVFIAWLNDNSSTESVGYFNAGFTLVNRYVGFILGAVATEYYPRLARIAGDRSETDRHVSTEIGVGMKLFLPFVLLFIAASGLIVRLLYSSEFEVIVPFISWAIIGTVFRFVSWCLAFVILARGDGRIYVVTEVASSVVYLVVNIFSYTRWGIAGMGYAYCLWYFVYLLMVGAVYFLRYRNRLENKTIALVAAATLLSVAGLLLSQSVGWWIPALMACLVGVPSVLSLRRGASR